MYCFITPNQLANFKNQQLPFTLAASLHDPFLHNVRLYQGSESAPLSRSEFLAAVQDIYQRQPDHVRAMVDWEYYQQQALDNRADVEKQIQRQQIKQSLIPLSHYHGLCCLRLFPKLMHVALWQRHAGEGAIAVELDVSHGFFRDAHAEAAPQQFAPLDYDDARPNLPSKQQPFPGLLRQPEHLAFEQEWRLIRPIKAAHKSQGAHAWFRWPKGLVKSFCLALDADTAQQQQIKALQQDLRFRHCPVRQMAVSPSHLQLMPMDI